MTEDNNVKETISNTQELSIGNWSPDEAEALHSALELPNWAPWLAASVESLAGRAKNFPAGQMVLKNGPEYVASLSLNQIDWNGSTESLPSWDDVAGDPTDYAQTYVPGGNTLVLLSMNVAPSWKGKHIPGKMITAAQLLAQQLTVDHLIGSFRPSGFGELKKAMGYDLDFETYCHMKRHAAQQPLDPWLGNLWRFGMEMIVPDPKAMTVAVTEAEFYSYHTHYHPGQWQEVTKSIWECGEVGQWAIENGIAVYRESNMWGRLPIYA